MARFDNKVVLVSGRARVQGAAEGRLLIAQGAKVVIGDVLGNQGQALAVVQIVSSSPGLSLRARFHLRSLRCHLRRAGHSRAVMEDQMKPTLHSRFLIGPYAALRCWPALAK
jgi:NAD(P)-dependent dehydrogenase (short-subunit alcohol dehydrogenase family)